MLSVPYLWLIFGPTVITALVLPRFTPTLTRFQVKRSHLSRLGAYAAPIWARFGTTWLLAELLIRGYYASGLDSYFDLEPIGIYPRVFGELWPYLSLVGQPTTLLMAILFGWWWVYLYHFLRRYLRLDRRSVWGLLLSTQALALVLWLPPVLIVRALWVYFVLTY